MLKFSMAMRTAWGSFYQFGHDGSIGQFVGTRMNQPLDTSSLGSLEPDICLSAGWFFMNDDL